MRELKVIKVNEESIEFDNGIELYSDELIAAFIGWEKSDGNDGVFHKGVWYDEKFNHYDTLNFHKSWDLLMIAVKKIESIAPTRVIIDCNECKIIGDKRFKVHTLNKFNSVYQCVVQFIEWYNTTTQHLLPENKSESNTP